MRNILYTILAIFIILTVPIVPVYEYTGNGVTLYASIETNTVFQGDSVQTFVTVSFYPNGKVNGKVASVEFSYPLCEQVQVFTGHPPEKITYGGAVLYLRKTHISILCFIKCASLLTQ